MKVLSPKKSNKIYAVFTFFSICIFVLFFSSNAIANAGSPGVSSLYNEIFRLNDYSVKVTNASYYDKTVEITLKCKLMNSYSSQLYPEVTKVTFDGLPEEYQFKTGEKVDDYSQYVTVSEPPASFNYIKIVVSSAMPDTVVEDSYNEFGELIPGYTKEGKVHFNTVTIDKRDMSDKRIEIVPAHQDESAADEFDTITYSSTVVSSSLAHKETAASTTAAKAVTKKTEQENEPAYVSDKTTEAPPEDHGDQSAFVPGDTPNTSLNDHNGETAYVPDQDYTPPQNQGGEAAYVPDAEPVSANPIQTGQAVMKTTTTAKQTAPEVVHCTGIRLVTDFENNNIKLKTGETSTVKAEITPENASDKSVVWTSNREDIASVDADGRITARSTGKAIITAKTSDGNLTASCMVTVG